MARQLKPDERVHFVVALQNPESLGQNEAAFHQSLDAKRDVAMRLSPELEAWFGKEFLPWLNS